MSYSTPELYIQLRDGQPYEHPILGDNFREAFPDVDITTLPNDRFARFIRLPQPPLGPDQVFEGVAYEWDGNVVTDVHRTRQITAEERAERTAERRIRAHEFKDRRITFITSMLNAGLSEEANALWTECLVKHEAWELDENNPTPIAPFPYKDENGNWVAPAS